MNTLLFICLNLLTMVLQVVTYSYLLFKNSRLKTKLAAHLLLQFLVFCLLLWGAFVTFGALSLKQSFKGSKQQSTTEQNDQI